MKITTALAAGLGGIGAISAACLTYATTIELNAFHLRRVTVAVLPPKAESVRVLHLSDLHLLGSQTRKIAWVRALADLEPHFVVNTGDNVAEAAALHDLAHALSPLAGVPGVFVFGSNDYHSARPINPVKYFHPSHPTHVQANLPTAALALTLEGLGWADAEQRRLQFRLEGTTIEVRGCGDHHAELDDYPVVAGPISPEVDLLMGVTHSPYRAVLDQMTLDGAGLILCGHTHGGQVCLPGGRALTTNCDLPASAAKGLSRHRVGEMETALHVSAGLGTSPYAPYRFCCPPEATLLTLTARPDRD
ncbi:MAG: metallophosphoesterase [Propionibacteriaceae bacterium]|jgi:predicted MPP superfamily phosphohydrolase|nr:metallophosphoesterase [Propionibacteriaceae bacterium]